MAKPVSIKPKKKRGRPATGKDPLVGVRMPPALIEQVDAWANHQATGRSEAVRRLVEIGLMRTRKSDK